MNLNLNNMWEIGLSTHWNADIEVVISIDIIHCGYPVAINEDVSDRSNLF